MGKVELMYKQIGANVIVTIKGKKLVKVEKDKTKRDGIINKIKLYNKLNSEAKLKEIVTLFSKEEAAKTKTEAVKKGVKKAIKKVEKSAKKNIAKNKAVQKDSIDLVAQLVEKSNEGGLTEDEISTLRALLDKNKKVEQTKEQIAPVVTSPSPRRGEY